MNNVFIEFIIATLVALSVDGDAIIVVLCDFFQTIAAWVALLRGFRGA
jgi:hypothetical protein